MVGDYGLSLLGYYIYLKHGSIFESYYKNWEKRKIKEYLDEETHSETKTSRWE